MSVNLSQIQTRFRKGLRRETGKAGDHNYVASLKVGSKVHYCYGLTEEEAKSRLIANLEALYGQA